MCKQEGRKSREGQKNREKSVRSRQDASRKQTEADGKKSREGAIKQRKKGQDASRKQTEEAGSKAGQQMALPLPRGNNDHLFGKQPEQLERRVRFPFIKKQKQVRFRVGRACSKRCSSETKMISAEAEQIRAGCYSALMEITSSVCVGRSRGAIHKLERSVNTPHKGRKRKHSSVFVSMLQVGGARETRTRL